MSSRKGGGPRGGYDDDDLYDYEDDDDYYSDDFDDDEGYDAFDRGGGGATVSAKQKKQQAQQKKQQAQQKKPAAPPKKATTKPAAAPAKKEAPEATADATSAAVAPRLAQQLSLSAPRDRPYSHPKELVAALESKEPTIRKPELHVVVLGHVDAGKSTLVGRLLSDVGAVPQREAHKVAEAARKAGKGSFSWAWLLDATDDERSRGVTVEVGEARVSTDELHVTLLDAPGHSDFVPEAISGVAVADAALLVVDGSRGGFEAGFDGNKDGAPADEASRPSRRSGQTKEHAALARALGVRQVVVAVTKLDTLDYDRDRFEEIRARLGAFLSTLGFDCEKGVRWLPVSAPEGQNVSRPPDDPRLLSWWKGGGEQTLLAALGTLPAPPRSVDAPLRLPLSGDVLSRPARAGQACALLSGKIEAGAVAAGMEVVAVPPGGSAGAGRVVSVVVRGGGGETTTSSGDDAVAVAGDSCDVVVSGPLAETGVLARGAVLCPVAHPVSLATKFVARIKVLEAGSGGGGGGGAASPSFSSPGAAGIVLPGSSVTLHVGSAVRPATITRLVSLLDPRTGEETKKRPRLVAAGQAALVEVAPEGEGVAVVVGGDSGERGGASPSALSRVALREAGKTLAVGVVVEVVE